MNIRNIPKDFDWREYLRMNPDLQSKGFDKRLAKYHWCEIGYREGRSYKEPRIEIPPVPGEKIMYTCVAGGYDRLRNIDIKEPGWRYMCYVDDPDATNLQSTGWEIEKIPDVLMEMTSVRRARALKILPHLFLPKHDISMWIDASVRPKVEADRFIHLNLQNYDLAISKHPHRTCVYKEAETVKRVKKCAPEEVDAQIYHYRIEGFPEEAGLVQTGVLCRRNVPEVAKFCERWWKEVDTYSHRDQLSFNYVLWRSTLKVKIIHENIFSNGQFMLDRHIKGNSTYDYTKRARFDVDKYKDQKNLTK